MGNAPSSKRSRVQRELERFVKPTGLYPSCRWDERQVRRLILDGKIAPRLIGFDTKYQGTRECPICFLRYCAVNVTACCKKPICSECYLQVTVPRGSSPCPFCNNARLQALYGTHADDKMIEKEMSILELHDRISDSEEQGVSLVPVLTQPEGVDVGDAHAVSLYVPLATVDDRRLVEAEVRKQFDLEQQRSEVQEARHGRAIWTADGRRTGGQRRAESGRRSQGDADVRRALLQSLGMPSDLGDVEELMLMEAIRQSMEDHGRARLSPPLQQHAQAADGEGIQAMTPGANEDGGEGGAAAGVDTKEAGVSVLQQEGESQALCHMSRRMSSGGGSWCAQSSTQESRAGQAALALGDEEAKDEGRRTPRCHRRSSASSTSSGSASSASQVRVLADGANLISSIRLGAAAAAAQQRQHQQQAANGDGPIKR